MCRYARWLPPLCSEHIALELDEEKGKINPVAKAKVGIFGPCHSPFVSCIIDYISGYCEEVWAGHC